jgi:hypothetical protein
MDHTRYLLAGSDLSNTYVKLNLINLIQLGEIVIKTDLK